MTRMNGDPGSPGSLGEIMDRIESAGGPDTWPAPAEELAPPASQISELPAAPDGAHVSIAGRITAKQVKVTKNGNPWARCVVEDVTGAIEVLFFPQTYPSVSHVLAEDLVVVVRGRVNRRDDDDVPTIYAQEVTLPEPAEGLAPPASQCPTCGAYSPAEPQHRAHETAADRAIVAAWRERHGDPATWAEVPS
jgi:DNA polymerase III alpha subunit